MPAHAAAAVTVKVVTPGHLGEHRLHLQPGPGSAVPRAAGRRGERGLQRPADRDRRDQPVHLVGERAGALPPGLTLNASTGLLSGTPTTAGTYSFTVKVTDSSGQSDTEPVTVTIIPGRR